MIKKVRKRFILASSLAILIVFSVIFSAVCIITSVSLNEKMDSLADTIVRGNGKFPDDFQNIPDKNIHAGMPDFLTPETPFSTRYFSVRYGAGESIAFVNTEYIKSVTNSEAVEMANEVLKKSKSSGWYGNYRYSVHYDDSPTVVFVDGSMYKSMAYSFILSALAILLGSSAVIILIIVLLSQKIVNPIAESYEKQKQFITDASHELKTPLTLIQTNLDIAMAEGEGNEWLSDAREECDRMTGLIGKMVELTRLDEDKELKTAAFSLSEAISETASEFLPLALKRSLTLDINVEDGIIYVGSEESMRRLASILLDNAIKYCDENGSIRLDLKKKRGVSLSVTNTRKDVESLELDRFFERFYRADKSRSKGNGYGIGLSIAREIVAKHHGNISARAEDGEIIFEATL